MPEGGEENILAPFSGLAVPEFSDEAIGAAHVLWKDEGGSLQEMTRALKKTLCQRQYGGEMSAGFGDGFYAVPPLMLMET